MVSNQLFVAFFISAVSNGFTIPPPSSKSNSNIQRTFLKPVVSCLFSQMDDRLASQTSDESNDIISSASLSDEEFIEHIVTLSKPMGLVIEEVDTNAKSGVQISSINPEGAAIWKDICIGDKLLEINGNDCSENSFDEVMKLLKTSSEFIQLTLGRPSQAVSVRWPNGVGIASLPGRILGNVAVDASYHDIEYSCQSGSCATCEQRMIIDGSETRYVRPCVARVPSSASSIVIEPSDRYHLR